MNIWMTTQTRDNKDSFFWWEHKNGNIPQLWSKIDTGKRELLKKSKSHECLMYFSKTRNRWYQYRFCKDKPEIHIYFLAKTNSFPTLHERKKCSLAAFCEFYTFKIIKKYSELKSKHISIYLQVQLFLPLVEALTMK